MAIITYLLKTSIGLFRYCSVFLINVTTHMTKDIYVVMIAHSIGNLLGNGVDVISTEISL